MSRRREWVNAGGWAAAGVIILVASWRLDRLDKLNINPWSAPGLTPGVVGALIILVALALAVQAWREPPSAAAEDGQPSAAGTGRRSLVAAVLCVLFAGYALGRGLPFVVEGALFILVFTSVFSYSIWRAEGRVARALMQTLAVAVGASLFISWLFESVFLVRLP